jgi:hypothetical protein
MAQLQNITLEAVGFAGLNTQDVPLAVNPSFAAKADNCVIDPRGRIEARKGQAHLVASSGTEPVHALFNFKDLTGREALISAHNRVIQFGETALTNLVIGTERYNENHWKIVSLQNHCYLFQEGCAPRAIKFAGGDGLSSDGETIEDVLTVDKIIDYSDAVGAPPLANEVLSAYGRLWAAGTGEDKHTVYWSDLLNGRAWSGGTSGYVDLTTVWPTGHDEIVALAAHNGFLVIFGKKSIVVYSGAASPSSMTLSDTVAGVGCIARDSVQHTGSDIIFLSSDGLRTFGRTIQEKSMPIGNLSRNVHDKLLASVQTNVDNRIINSVYNPEKGEYILSLPDAEIMYVFNIAMPLEDGSPRVTTWTNVNTYSMHMKGNDILLGKSNGIYRYGGHFDYTNASSKSWYVMEYRSNPMDFGHPSNLKFLKKFEVTAIGNHHGDESAVYYYYDYQEDDQFLTQYDAPALPSNVAQFQVSDATSQNEYEDDGTVGTTVFEYDDGVSVHTPKIMGQGSGEVVTIGVKTAIYGAPYSYQRIGIHATLGRLL